MKASHTHTHTHTEIPLEMVALLCKLIQLARAFSYIVQPFNSHLLSSNFNISYYNNSCLLGRRELVDITNPPLATHIWFL